MCFFSPIRNDPKKTHKQNFGTHPPSPGTIPQICLCLCVFFLSMWLQSPKTMHAIVRARAAPEQPRQLCQAPQWQPPEVIRAHKSVSKTTDQGSRTSGKFFVLLPRSLYCPRRNYYWINSEKGRVTAIFMTFLPVRFQLICPARGVKPENCWKR